MQSKSNINNLSRSFSKKYGPNTLSIITTYRCTSKCEGCCFNCGPDLPFYPEFDKISGFINIALKKFKTIKLVVFSGGECFLLGDELVKLVSFVSAKKIFTRCVTNGYWANTLDNAFSVLKKLKEAGLTEINFSAGFAHNKYVPIDFVVNGIVASARLNITTVVSIESNSKFNEKVFLGSKEYRDFIYKYPEKSKLIKIISTGWSLLKKKDRKYNVLSIDKGCETILDTILVTPDFKIKSCCGLYVNRIKEMDIGKASINFDKPYYEQFDDFLKIWIKVEGPIKIIRYISSLEADLDEPVFNHICEACLYIYSNKTFRKAIAKHYKNKIEDVVFKFLINKEINYRSEKKLIGYGI
ncbi:MAG: hypothetical protein L6420_06125 [Elusimicrobia bacterium]|nr:hypothetical protein [Elusimicrobiota bacterium]